MPLIFVAHLKSGTYFLVRILQYWSRTTTAPSMKTFYTIVSKKAFIGSTLTAVLFLSGLTRTFAQNASASSSNNLPALIMAFSGEVSQNDVVLSWTMENETNCKYFVIERSGNGSSFDSIDVVTGLNNSHQTEYSYTDMHSLYGDNYYRLRQVDRDGVIKYSKVLSFNNNNAPANKLQVYPNPASAVVNFKLNSSVSDLVTVQVYNLAGVIVLSRQQQLSAGYNQQSIAISTLKSGNYFLKVINKEGNSQYVQSFVKLM